VLSWDLYQGFRRFRGQTQDDQAALETVAQRVNGSIFNPEKTTFAIIGTHSRFGHWMISTLYHLPTDVIRSDVRKGGHLF